jgi:hypothetical protein
MKKYNDKQLSEILDKLSDETKNFLIKALLKYDRENVDIVSEPIYRKIVTDNGNVDIDIKDVVYGVAVTHKAEEYREYDFTYEISYVDKDYAYHIVEANKDNFEEIIYNIFANGGFEVEIACTYLKEKRE